MLTPWTFFSAAVLLTGLLVYHYLIRPAFLSPLSKIPTAHPLCALSGRWLTWQQKQKNEAKALYAAHQQHGPIVRLGPQEVGVNSIEGLRSIYTAGLEKSAFYQEDGKFENYSSPNLVSTLDHRTHSAEKRMISSVYAKSYVQHSADVATISTRIVFARFLPLLRGYASGKEQVNCMDLFQWSGIDFMSAYHFGTARSTDFLRDKAGREAYFGDWTKFRDDLELVGEKKVVEGVCMQMLDTTLQEQSSDTPLDGTKAVVAHLLHSQLSQKAKRQDDSQAQDALKRRCASELLDHMIATHETFAITLTYVVYQLSLQPKVQAELRSELLTLDPPVSHQTAENTLPPPEKIDSLPLLNAILMETLRMYAPVPGRLPRVVPAGGLKLHDYYIPAGTTVSCNAYSLHRKEDIFPDPFKWTPARWMAEEHRAALGDDFPPPEVIRRYMWAFGSGGRMCIGSNFAIQLLKLLIASIYTSFTTSIIDDEGIEQSDTLIGGPKSGRLIVQFHEIADNST